MKVFVNDAHMTQEQATQHFSDADAWAQKFCASYQGHYIQDVSDFSYIYDRIAAYQFSSDQDVVLFKLRWS